MPDRLPASEREGNGECGFTWTHPETFVPLRCREPKGHDGSHFVRSDQSIQRQDSLTAQLNTIQTLAVQVGCYDAADWIAMRRASLPDTEHRVTEGFEFGIAHRGTGIRDPHRVGMTLPEAHAWLAGWVEDGGKPDAFYIIRRSLGPWERTA